LFRAYQHLRGIKYSTPKSSADKHREKLLGYALDDALYATRDGPKTAIHRIADVLIREKDSVLETDYKNPEVFVSRILVDKPADGYPYQPELQKSVAAMQARIDNDEIWGKLIKLPTDRRRVTEQQDENKHATPPPAEREIRYAHGESETPPGHNEQGYNDIINQFIAMENNAQSIDNNIDQANASHENDIGNGGIFMKEKQNTESKQSASPVSETTFNSDMKAAPPQPPAHSNQRRVSPSKRSPNADHLALYNLYRQLLTQVPIGAHQKTIDAYIREADAIPDKGTRSEAIMTRTEALMYRTQLRLQARDIRDTRINEDEPEEKGSPQSQSSSSSSSSDTTSSSMSTGNPVSPVTAGTRASDFYNARMNSPDSSPPQQNLQELRAAANMATRGMPRPEMGDLMNLLGLTPAANKNMKGGLDPRAPKRQSVSAGDDDGHDAPPESEPPPEPTPPPAAGSPNAPPKQSPPAPPGPPGPPRGFPNAGQMDPRGIDNKNINEGTRDPNGGDKVVGLPETVPPNDVLRTEFTEADSRLVIPSDIDQIRSDIEFDMFSVVRPGFGLGADNKLFAFENIRDREIIGKGPLFLPRAYDGPTSGVDTVPLLLQNVLPTNVFQKNKETDNRMIRSGAMTTGMTRKGSLNVLGDDYGQLDSISDRGLNRPPESFLEPVIRIDSRWQRAKLDPGFRSSERQFRRLHDSLRYPEHVSPHMNMDGGPTMKKARASLEVLI
jgi:hypothetical protein